jgi:hypothetical protein
MKDIIEKVKQLVEEHDAIEKILKDYENEERSLKIDKAREQLFNICQSKGWI